MDQAARHLHAVPAQFDSIETLRRALGEAATAPDLRGAFGAIAGWLAPAVGAKAALILDAPADEVITSLAGMHDAHRAEPGDANGTVVVVIPSTGAGDESQITGVVHAFAELAELCVAHAVRIYQAENDVDSDWLTGCLTRRALDRTIATELQRSDRSGAPFSIAFFDIDDFKHINEERGHLKGDEVLGAVGGALAGSARATDFVGRYGGDEFVVVMPGTEATAAAAACARLVADVAAAGRAAGTPELGLTFGISTWSAGAQAAALIEAADCAMFRTRRARDV